MTMRMTKMAKFDFFSEKNPFKGPGPFKQQVTAPFCYLSSNITISIRIKKYEFSYNEQIYFNVRRKFNSFPPPIGPVLLRTFISDCFWFCTKKNFI